jgi:PmbA protein
MSELLELAESVVARATGDEQIEVYATKGVDAEIRAYQGEIESLSSATSAGIGVRVLVDGEGGPRVGSAWAGSLEESAVEAALAEARDNLRFASPDEYLCFASPDGVAPASLDLFDATVSSTPMDDKIAMAIELERIVRGADARIRQVEVATYNDYVAESAIASTTGVRASTRRSGAYLSVEAIAGDGDDSQTGWGLSVGRGPGDLDVNQAADDAVVRAVRLLGARKPSTMRTTVVFDPRSAATLLALIGSALSGDAVVRGRSFFADRLGDEVAAGSMTLVDDPTDPRHFAATPFDGEGLATRRNVLIEAGRLRGFVYDTVSARRAGVTSTGSAARGGIGGTPSAACRALQLAPGTLDQAEILREIGDGMLVFSLNGVHSGVNTVSGDFSVGVTGLMVRNGEVAEPVREATVASTLQRMLLDVTHVGSDVEWLPGVAAGQSLAIADIAVSGA